jgi:branched-chain amino acid transport system substrate-binding protein
MKRRAALASSFFLPALVRAAGAQPRGEAIKIGLTIPLTGPYANTVADFLPAFQMSVDALNAAGGVKGRPLRLLVEDSQATPQGGIAAFRKLVQVDGVKVMLTLFTNVVAAQIPLAAQLQMPTVAVVETPVVNANAEWVFGHGTRTDLINPLLSAYWKKNRYKRLYTFLGNNATGQALTPSLIAAAKDAGVEQQIAYINYGDTDYRGEIARAKDFNPDGLLINTSGSATDGVVIRQSRELGMTAQWYSQANFFTEHAWVVNVGPYVEGMIFGGARVDPVQARDFIHTYNAKMGFLPGYPQGEMYDTVKIAAYGLEHGGDSAVGIRDAIGRMKGLRGSLGGSLAMGPDHFTIIASIGLYRVVHGVEVRLT